jgi:hypothetical protein
MRVESLRNKTGGEGSTENAVNLRNTDGWAEGGPSMRTTTPFPLPAELINRVTPISWQLWWTWQETQLQGTRPWAFALPVEKLLDTGVRESDLSWLIERHLLEKRSMSDTSRENSGGESIVVILTAEGAASLEQHCLRGVKPDWDSCRRILTVRGRVIKSYRQPSGNQETILSAFEEERWADHIDDPLPRSSTLCDCDPRSRLRKTAEHLNRAQYPPTLFFSVAGNGEHVCWSFRHASPSKAAPNHRRNSRAMLPR